GPRLPAQGRRLHPGLHRDLDRIQAQERGGRHPPPPAPLRVFAVFRYLMPHVPGATELLLAPGLTPERAAELLRPYGFADPGQADRELQALAEAPQARRLLAGVLDDLLAAAGDSADPDAALSRLERFVRAAGSAARVFSHLESDRRMVDVLLRALGGSPF